jgi:hypothetical protein
MKLLVILSISLSFTAHAATSGILNISGVVPVLQSVVITPNGTNNTTLNLLAGEVAKNIATVTETSNNALGYTIQASSLNNGFLVLTTDNTKKTAYQISYNGGSYTTITTVLTQVKNVASLSGNTVSNSVVLINVTALPNAVAGTYNDVITISIVAN